MCEFDSLGQYAKSLGQRGTAEFQHMSNPTAKRCLRESPRRFEAHCD